MSELILKKLVRNNELIINICDKELLNKTFEEGEKILDLTTEFYKGELTNIDEIKKYSIQAKFITFVGENSIKTAQEIFNEITILKIANIPFTNILKF